MNKICPIMTRDIKNPIECQERDCPIWVVHYISSSEFGGDYSHCGLRERPSVDEIIRARSG